MRRLPLVPLLALVLCALVGAQGERAGKTREFRQEATAGPGYLQARFFTRLEDGFSDEFTERRADQMFRVLRRREPGAAEVVRLMNGHATTSGMERMFGMRRREVDRARRVLDATVEAKDRRLFFGVLAFVMIGEFDIDPTSPFLKQVLGARDELDSDEFRALRIGRRSKRSMREYFGLRSREDQKFMIKVLDRVRDSFYLNHPLCESLGLGSAREYDAALFPKLAEGMPGSEKEYGEGKAAGLPFDRELPPLPFAGKRVDELLEKEKK
jgi:hypothetical protein